MHPTRREFLAAASLAGPSGRRIWMDPAIARQNARPWRKVHLDFHNSAHITSIGQNFSAEEFGERLAAASVDAIVVFAKDMHGYFYYPSRYGPVHPGLKFDLLGRQVEACRKRNIAVYAYYCTTWDNYLAEQHPDWLVVKRDRTTYLPKFDETPGWTALCTTEPAFVQTVVDHTREFVSRYELDGAWFDMPVPRGSECYCRRCLAELRRRSLDPFDAKVQHEHKHALHIEFLRRLRAAVLETRGGCQVDFNNQCVYGLGERAPLMDNIDIEALPTAFWGYWYFPLTVRFARTFGITTYGMTGRFQSAWADFGGLKLPAQLDTELSAIVANGARCDIGDQMPPSGRLDPAVYHVIGKSYGRIKALEPYLEGAAPVTEAALLVGGLPLQGPETEANYGIAKLLLESRVQFDVVETDGAWERYGIVVAPEDTPISAAVAARLHEYAAGGGKVIVSGKGALVAGGERSWLDKYGLEYAGESPFKPAYMIPEARFAGDIPMYEYALYQGALQWRAAPPAAVVARLGEPAFQRAPNHYTSHAQTPFERATPFSAIAISGNVGMFGFPLGRSYYNHGYWVYRNAFRHVLDALMPGRLIETNAPLSTELTVTHQTPAKGRRERYMVHIINFSGVRRTPRHPDFYEDPIALTDVSVKLNVAARWASVRAVVAGQELPARPEVTVPRIPIHEILLFEVA